MNKLTALVEAARSATQEPSPYVCELLKFNALANPATILELCALLEKAEEALDTCHERNHHEDYDLVTTQHFNGVLTKEALAAIKQWKEQT